ncbi:MAG: SLC13 family permease, partial [Planctomycetota bacterium]
MDGMILLASSAQVPIWVTVVFALLLVGLILSLAFEEKLHAKKSVIAGTFAILCLFLGTLWGVLPFEDIVVGSHELVEHQGVVGEYVDEHDIPHTLDLDPLHEHAAEGEHANGDAAHDEAGVADEAGAGEGETGEHTEAPHGRRPVHVDGHRILMPVYIPAVDWGVIAIILGSSLFVDITSKSGLFTWIALKVTKASKGDPRTLLFFYGIMTVVFSAVLNNVTAMIIIGSLTAVSLKKLGREEKLLGFLLIEGLLTNVGGLLTLISSVPNIIVGTAANISFTEFVWRAAPYVVVSTLITLVMGAYLFQIRSLRTAEEKTKARELVDAFDENDGIESWGFFWFGAAMLVLFILTIATTSVLPVISDLEMGFVALAFAAIMLLRYKSEADEFYRALDWDLIGFFMALFVVINVMEHALVLDYIGQALAVVVNQG